MQRGVTKLVHVTSGKSLARILEEGIKPYNPIFKEEYQPANSTYNQKRSHFTIQYPHPFIKKETPVAILVSPELADRHDASFTVTTSARKGVMVCIGTKEIGQLFAEKLALPSRSKRLVRHPESPSDMPTSQMAEVRFSSVVSPSDFMKIVFPTLRAVLEYESSYGCLPSDNLRDVDERLFAFSQVLCTSNYYGWFRKFDDKRRVVLLDWARKLARDG